MSPRPRRRRPAGWKNATDNATASGRYGTEHKRLRAQWKVKVDAGEICCWRCGEWIPPRSRWHLGHSDDGSQYMGPEHWRCNVRAASREAHRRRWHGQPFATCRQCLEPYGTDSCVGHHITFDGKAYECRTWGEEDIWLTETPEDPDIRCHDCGCALGGCHHWGCCVEQCAYPGCDDQLLFCFHAIRDDGDTPPEAA